MNWTKNAKDDLRTYREKQAGQANLRQRIDELTAQMDRIKSQDLSKDRVQGGTPNNDALLGIIDEKARLCANLKSVNEYIQRVERGLAVLTPEETAVLTAAYINARQGGRYAEEVSQQINYGERTIYYIRSAALRKFTRAMYGVVEE